MQKRTYFSDTRLYQRLTKSFLASLFVLSGWPFAGVRFLATRSFIPDLAKSGDRR